MNVDRVVLTTFAGYFFSQISCLRSIQQYAAGLPIDIIIDDFDIKHWPDYPVECEKYILENFPSADITFHRFSDLAGLERVRTGGWFRQQLVKLYLDQFVTDNNWLLVDADVTFCQPVRLNTISASLRTQPTPVDIGNRLYVKYMLDCETPWVIDPDQYWCLSGVPFRYLNRRLLENVRHRIEAIHGQSTLDLHIGLFDSDSLVAYDPGAKTMIMSEFQLIEIFRHRYSDCALPIGLHTASNFEHTSIKDWNTERDYFEQKSIAVSDTHWAAIQNFGKHHV